MSETVGLRFSMALYPVLWLDCSICGIVHFKCMLFFTIVTKLLEYILLLTFFTSFFWPVLNYCIFFIKLLTYLLNLSREDFIVEGVKEQKKSRKARLS